MDLNVNEDLKKNLTKQNEKQILQLKSKIKIKMASLKTLLKDEKKSTKET